MTPQSGSVAVRIVEPATGGPVDRYEVSGTGMATQTVGVAQTLVFPVPDCGRRTFTVTAIGTDGDTAASSADAAGCVPPGAVQGIGVTTEVDPANGTVTAATVTWQPPTETGGGEVEYVVVLQDASGAQSTPQVVTSPVFRTVCCAGGTPYTGASVAARNAVGTGPARLVSFQG